MAGRGDAASRPSSSHHAACGPAIQALGSWRKVGYRWRRPDRCALQGLELGRAQGSHSGDTGTISGGAWNRK